MPEVQDIIQRFTSSKYITAMPPPLAYLRHYPSQHLLRVIYSTLLQLSKTSDIQSPTRNIVNALIAYPRPKGPSKNPPLLPLLINWFVPTTLAQVGSLAETEIQSQLEVLLAMVSTSLVQALRIEKATFDAERYQTEQLKKHPPSLEDADAMEVERAIDWKEKDETKNLEDQSTSAVTLMAQRFSKSLKATKGNAASILHKKLASSPTFISNFPLFVRPS